MFRTAATRAVARASSRSTSTSTHFNKTAASRRTVGVAHAPLQQHQQQAFSSSTTTTTPGSSSQGKLSYDVVPKEDFGQYKEYSVIFTNRALNLMSDPFQKVMRDLNDLLKTTYNADKVAIIPGSG